MKTNEKLEDISEELFIISGSLNGIGGLLTQGTRNPGLDGDEMFGLGQLIKFLSQQISVTEKTLKTEIEGGLS